jgi:hypothetical protein
MLKYYFLIGAAVLLIIGAIFLFRSGQQFGDVAITPTEEPPVPTMSDQDIYDTILAAEKDGKIPTFTVDETSDLKRISAQYIQVAKDAGVDTTDATPDEKNLYLASRTALVDNGTPVEDLTAEAAAVVGEPIP